MSEERGEPTPRYQRYLWLLPVGLALLVFLPSEEFRVGGDGWRYMTRAIGLAEGRGYVDIDWSPLTYRGPFYPLWMSGFFALFGYEAGVGYLATRLFSVFGAIVFYALGARWFGAAGGALTSLLILTSAALSNWSDEVHIDYVLAVMMTLAILGITWALETERRSRYVLAGAVLAASYLVKQTTILLVPFPVLAVLFCKDYRTWQRLLRVGLLLVTFVVAVAPWWLYVWRLTGEFSLVGGGTAARTSGWFLEASTGGGLEIVEALRSYYGAFLGLSFGLAPLLTIGWLGTVVLAFKGRTWAQLLCAIAICLGPLILLQGQVGYREQQSMIFYFSSYFGLVGVGRSVTCYLYDRFSLASRTRTVITGLLAAGLIVLQIGLEGGRWLSYIGRHNPLGYASKSWEELAPVRSKRPRRAAAWLFDNAAERAGLLGEKSPVGPLAFYTRGNYPIFQPPRPVSFVVQLESEKSNGSTARPCGPQRVETSPVLFLWLAGTNREAQGASVRIAALTESHILKTFEGGVNRGEERAEARYIALTRQNRFTLPYYVASPHFRKIQAVSKPNLILVEALRLESSDFPVHVDRRLPRFLKYLRDSSPRKHERVVDCFLKDRLGFSEQEVDDIENGLYQTFRYEHRIWLLPRELARGPRARERNE